MRLHPQSPFADPLPITGEWPFEDLDPREVMSPAELLEDALLDASPTERKHMLACIEARYFW